MENPCVGSPILPLGILKNFCLCRNFLFVIFLNKCYNTKLATSTVQNMNIKKYAFTLRKKGFSYSQINKKTGIAKSTLSYWLIKNKSSQFIKRNNSFLARKNNADRITQYNIDRAKLIAKKWEEFQKITASHIKTLTARELLLVSTALYWGEGYKRGKWSFVFCNSDPNVINLMMKFLIRIYKIKTEKIIGQVQIHNKNKENEAILYWSHISRIPKNQFMKSLLSTPISSKKKIKRKLPYGTFRIRINDVTLINTVKGYIQGIINAIKK